MYVMIEYFQLCSVFYIKSKDMQISIYCVWFFQVEILAKVGNCSKPTSNIQLTYKQYTT